MGPFHWFLCIYIIGGVTFIPLILCLILLHVYAFAPKVTATPLVQYGSIQDAADDGENIKSGQKAAGVKPHPGDEERESAGYFAVCREWIPGGINGKPPERTTPAGEVIAGESPSVYQNMYRSLFDRKQVPTMDVGRANGKSVKRARNVFYVVLRHGHLMLYDDSEQIEVRHVISLSHHEVTIYGGGEVIPEGELWIKRNAIRLTRKFTSADADTVISKPFYLFSENCSEKEDFYFALLCSQEKDHTDGNTAPLVQHFDVNDIIGLVQNLHSSEENLQAKWFNAMIGRLFLGVYRTQELEQFIRTKITKKISRVNKPAFLSGIVLKKIEMGTAAPFITNPRLKDLSIEGECCVEQDVSYAGNFRIEVATTAKIDLGTRFKAREVSLVLAITLKRLEGHLLVRFKPPPSNRIWISFEKMPTLAMNIEPIVSSRQITYGIIIRAIESRIREVVAETLVLPHWDDSPFLNTDNQPHRGGIWVDENAKSQPPTETIVPDESIETSTGNSDVFSSSVSGGLGSISDASMSTPSLSKTSKSNTPLKGNRTLPGEVTTISVEMKVQKPIDVPRAIRSKSFASVASPVVSIDNAESSHTPLETKKSKDAASFMNQLSYKSQPGSPVQTPEGSYSARSPLAERDRSGSMPSTSSRISDSELSSSQITLKGAVETLYSQSPSSAGATSIASSFESAPPGLSKLQAVAHGLTPSEKKQQSIAAAALAAKNWGWKTLTKGRGISSPTTPGRSGTPEHPIGRGRPLPPLGQPLPPPDKHPSAPSIGMTSDRSSLSSLNRTSHSLETKSCPIILPKRRDLEIDRAQMTNSQGLLVVEAPSDSVSGSSSEDLEYGEFIDNVKSDDDNDENDIENDDEGINIIGQAESANPTDVARENFVSKHNDDRAGGMGQKLPEIAISGNKFSTKSYKEDGSPIMSWQTAQEEHERSKSIWMDDHEHA